MCAIIFGNIKLGELGAGQTVGTFTLLAFKMQVIIMMSFTCTVIGTKAIFNFHLIVNDFVQDAVIDKRFEGTVYGDPIKILIGECLQVAVRQSVLVLVKQFQNRNTGRRNSEILSLK